MGYPRPACALFGLSRAALRKKIERGAVLVDMAGRVQVGSL
ncbi:hypothetical protein V3M49_00220 [Trueperella pyogenes]|uniref:DNA-binding protein n=1 Tax=Trueperella pyogenes TaxID=1661 RepID=A0ABV3N9W5_9ACTO